MKTLIFDATPLIYLTRVGLLYVIEAIPTRKFTSRSMFREVVESGKGDILPRLKNVGFLIHRPHLLLPRVVGVEAQSPQA